MNFFSIQLPFLSLSSPFAMYIQVLRFDDLSAHKPSLSLGHMLIPGSKPGYLCKPADVAVASSGTFYVADGYVCIHITVYCTPRNRVKIDMLCVLFLVSVPTRFVIGTFGEN